MLKTTDLLIFRSIILRFVHLISTSEGDAGLDFQPKVSSSLLTLHELDIHIKTKGNRLCV